MSAKTFVIVNDTAARARAAWVEVRRALQSAGVAFDAHEAREFGDARRAARRARDARYRTVAVVGGDGTLSEVVNGLFEKVNEADRTDGTTDPTCGVTERSSSAPGDDSSHLEVSRRDAALALLPAGTGNDFARALEGRRASLAHWIARLVAHCRAGDAQQTARDVDVLRGTVATSRHFANALPSDASRFDGGSGASSREFFCLNAVTLGVGAQVASRVAAQGRFARRLSGEARFALAALPAIAGWRERRVRVQIGDEEARELKTNLIAVVNSPFAGGGMMFSPAARLDDGLLDVVTATQLSRVVLAREMMRIHAGGHVANPRVSIQRAARVLVEQVTDADALPVEADGDVRGQTPLTLSVIPRALRVVI